DVFMLEFEKPCSMTVASEYIMSHGRMQTFPPWEDEFKLTP
ncbi:lF-82, partial [Cronobacter sakazakii]|nr:lF-82 [Cronobacter sakazakii]